MNYENFCFNLIPEQEERKNSGNMKSFILIAVFVAVASASPRKMIF